MILQLAVILVFSALTVLIHELGHYAMARLVGFKVNEFSLGFGPTLFKRNFNQTDWVLKLVPGAGRINVTLPKEMTKKNLIKYMLISLAGPGINIVFGFALIFHFPLLAIFSIFIGLGNMFPLEGSDGFNFIAASFQYFRAKE